MQPVRAISSFHNRITRAVLNKTSPALVNQIRHLRNHTYIVQADRTPLVALRCDPLLIHRRLEPRYHFFGCTPGLHVPNRRSER